MIWPLMRFSLRRMLARTLAAAMVGVMVVIGALLAYTEPTVAALTEARSQAELLFRALGIGSSVSLTLHVVSLAFNLLLPLVGAVYAISVSALLMAALVESGEMAHFLAAPKSRAAIVRTQATAVLLGVLVIVGLPLAATIVGALLMHPDALNLDGILAAFGGLCALVLCMACFGLMVSCLMDTARAARRRSGLWVGLFFVAWMLSRSGAMLQYLAYVTPFTFYQPERLALLRPEAWVGAGALLALGVGCLVYGTVRFSGRDLPL